MYVSLSPGVKNSMSVWSIEAIGLYIVSTVSSNATCLGLRVKISNSVLTKDGTSAMADQLLIWIKKKSLFNAAVFLCVTFKIIRIFGFGIFFGFRTSEIMRLCLLQFLLMRDVLRLR